MITRVLLLAALAAILALPFWLRPTKTIARTDDTVVVVTPHNDAIRQEFARGFARWYKKQTGRSVGIDWRIVGGTADISRYLESAYTAAFEQDWSHMRHRPWNAAVQAGFQRPTAVAASPDIEAARAAFLASDVSCGIDVFFGGDAYQFGKEAEAGRLVDTGLAAKHPEWFGDDVIPLTYGGQPFRDAQGRWVGVVVSSYGILFNRDGFQRLGLQHAPEQWADLTDPRLVGEVGLADPTKSGSVCEAFENVIQQQMQWQFAAMRVDTGGRRSAEYARALREGWLAGLRLIQGMGANARYFTDSSQKPPIDVANGDCAAGLCIDFYGRQEQEVVRARSGSERIEYVTPSGGSSVSTDPIGLLRGAPHRRAAIAFIEYTLSLEGQKIWAFKPGEAGGPDRYALRRMPIRRDFYLHPEWKLLRSDPEDAPYDARESIAYHPEWTASLFREIGFVTRVMCQDTHPELVKAWRAIAAAPEPRRSQALAALQRLERVGYDEVRGEIHTRLNARDRVEEVRLATELNGYFRANYAEAEAIARGGRGADR